MTRFEYDPLLKQHIEAALERLHAEQQAMMPDIAPQLAAWQCALAGSTRPADYFRHRAAFPFMLFPWWLEGSLRGGAGRDPQLARAMVYSSVCGYYAIRMVDDVCDEQASDALRLLPALAFFQSEFQRAYGSLFPAGHAFWDAYRWHLGQSAQASVTDSAGGAVDWERFVHSAANKTCAGLIPLHAVAQRYGLRAPPGPWLALFRCMGQWHQLQNDLFDWQRDWQRGGATYFLSLLDTQGDLGQVLDTVLGRLDDLQRQMQAFAGQIGCDELDCYLASRTGGLREAVAPMRQLAAQLRPQAMEAACQG